MLELQLAFLNVNTDGVFNVNFMKKAEKDKKIPHLMQGFKEIWSENGDFISIQYAGTASTISNVTKTGSEGIYGLLQHGYVSITRFYQGTFEDDFKQQCIDLLLQKYNNPLCKFILIILFNFLFIISYFNINEFIKFNYLVLAPQIEEKLKQSESKFTIIEEIVLFIGSWNTAGIDIKDNMDLDKWLYPIEGLKTPDIYIVCLQEIVDLNAKNIILNVNSSKVDQWRNVFLKNINKIDK